MSGHFAKKAGGFAPAHRPDPPAQPWKADWMSDTPIRLTVGPVTMGGKMRSMMEGGMKEMSTSSRAQTAAVPMRAPYPSGHGSGVPSAAVGQKPFAYICLKAPWATGIMANEMPTTEIRPVPM